MKWHIEKMRKLSDLADRLEQEINIELQNIKQLDDDRVAKKERMLLETQKKLNAELNKYSEYKRRQRNNPGLL